MAIVNPATSVTYDDLPAETLTLIEDVVLNRRPMRPNGSSTLPPGTGRRPTNRIGPNRRNAQVYP